MQKKFAAAINCIDGRTQKPVIEFIINKFNVHHVDLITEPGPDKVLSENKYIDIIESVKRRTLVSVEKHMSKIVVIAGHHDCSANPVDKEEHFNQIKQAAQSIKEWNLKVDVHGIWVDENWKALLVSNE